MKKSIQIRLGYAQTPTAQIDFLDDITLTTWGCIAIHKQHKLYVILSHAK